MLHNIPDDIIYNIFSYLDDNTLLNAKELSKRYNLISCYLIRSKTSNLIKNKMFKHDYDRLYYLNKNNYYIYNIIKNCLNVKQKTRLYFTLQMFCIHTRSMNELKLLIEKYDKSISIL